MTATCQHMKVKVKIYRIALKVKFRDAVIIMLHSDWQLRDEVCLEIKNRDSTMVSMGVITEGDRVPSLATRKM